MQKICAVHFFVFETYLFSSVTVKKTRSLLKIYLIGIFGIPYWFLDEEKKKKLKAVCVDRTRSQ